MSGLFRIIKFAFQHFFRNIWLSVVTVTLLTLTLLSVNILLLLNTAADAAIRAVEKRVDITATFQIGTTEEEARQATEFLRTFSQVADVKVVTPDEALAAFKEIHADDEEILASLEEVEGNPFGYELVISAQSPDDFTVILEALDNPLFSDRVESKSSSDHQAVLSRLSDVSNKTRVVGAIVVAAFLLIAVLIAFNTVRVTIYIHREEIAIMRLVGASGRFIRAPYLLEAVIFAVLATAAAAAIVLPAASALDPAFGAYFEDPSRLSAVFVRQAPLIFGVELAGTAFVCIVSTAVAMRKYLKV